MTSTPIGVGTTYQCELKLPGQSATSKFEITEYEPNKTIVCLYREIHNTNQLERISEIISQDFIPHPFISRLQQSGLESAKLVHLLGVASFPDMKVPTEDLIAEGDRVVERWTQTQTLTGELFMNIAASNKAITIIGISIYRIANNKIAKHWANMDLFGMMAQLGAIPVPGM